ncbi:uncharacterized protein LOC122669295 [Telopea speciosissima]|uniref:uncharacterized protein LOC122669295 n=1 Tax=Telopea speciosissima TaxID=54955 RepID=UPI001CC68A0C|nr:uncharacterized protein LOC122669295 [Telopea speciosissima]
MGWAESEMRCKKHPMHRRTPGVCSYCLRERLIKLSIANNGGRGGMEEAAGSSCSSSLSSSPYSSGASSSDSSPLHDRFAYSEGRVGSSGFSLKSRSVVGFGPKTSRRRRVEVEGTDGNKKKGGFWSKLLRSTGKKTKKILLHSSTVKEISSHNRIY